MGTRWCWVFVVADWRRDACRHGFKSAIICFGLRRLNGRRSTRRLMLKLMGLGDTRRLGLDALLGNDAERARRKAAMDGVERSSVNEERLVQTARTAQESAETGENILSKLHDQREKILSARASAGHMERDMDKSEKRMTQLGCEKCMQRWAFCVLVVLVLGGLSFFLWWKLQHRDEERRRQEREGDVAYAMMASEWANDRAHAAARRLLRL